MISPMKPLVPPTWQDYQLLDSGNGQRLERFGQYTLIRPDPQAIWKPKSPKDWENDAKFEKISSEKGKWIKKGKVANQWQIDYKDLKFICKLTPFKHTGVFPEQAAHWDWIKLQLSGKDQSNILNLFGYTGGATLAAASAGAKVTHVDASYPTIGWARENQKASGLEKAPIRWILDDALKFCQRELKRGIKYNGIIMDPPIYGHGPKGEVWDFNKDFPKLVETCFKLLSDNPLFFLVNAYAISASSLMLENVLNDFLSNLGGSIESGELVLQDKSGRLLSTGIFARWSKI